MAEQFEATVATGAGMFLLWNPAKFESVVDLDTWEAELLEDEDIARHIATGSAVPINIGSDGAFAILVRIGSEDEPPTLNRRESRYLVVSSEPYLLTSGGRAALTGIEDVFFRPHPGALTFPLSPRRWSATVHIIAWDEEPGAKDATGAPTPDALPDFVVLLTPEGSTPGSYRTEMQTFPPPQKLPHAQK